MSSSRSRLPGTLPGRLALAAAAAALGLGLAACTGGGTARPAAQAPGANQLQNMYVSTVNHVLRSVVQIAAGNSTGSGVVYDDRGDIVTNAHVVGNSSMVMVRQPLGSGAVPARVVGSYPPDDIAVIRVQGSPSAFRPAEFGESRNIPVGTIVLAMGNPLGLGDTVTNGIVSGTGRMVGEGSGGNALIASAIQTSAAINPGNSGGALVTLDDKVIGIPTLAARLPDEGGAAPGIGFAIPSDTVRNIAGQLIMNGRVTRSDRASLGLTAEDDDSAPGDPAGVTVASVDRGGAGATAGLRAGDVITGLDRARIATVDDLEAALAQYPPGTKVTVRYTGDGSGRPHTATAALGTLGG